MNGVSCNVMLLSFSVPRGSPQNISATEVSSRSATLSWSPPLPENQNGIITNYIINASIVPSRETFQLISESTVLEIDTLIPHTTYDILIAASTSVGSGPFSTEFVLHTSEDSE